MKFMLRSIQHFRCQLVTLLVALLCGLSGLTGCELGTTPEEATPVTDTELTTPASAEPSSAASAEPEAKKENTESNTSAASESQSTPQATAAPAPALELPDVDVSNLAEEVQKQLEEARAAIDLDSPSREAVERLGMLYHAYERFDAAVQLYDWLAASEPTSPRWPYLAAQAYVTRKDAEKTVEKALQTIAIDPEFGYVQVLLANAYLSLGQYDKAQEAAVVAYKQDEGTIFSSYTLGITSLATKNYVYAVEYLKPVLDTNPRLGGVRAALASAFQGLGQEDKAKELVDGWEANADLPVLVDPLLSQIYQLRIGGRAALERGQMALAQGRYEVALEQYEQALNAEPNAISAIVGTVDALTALGRLKEAEAMIDSQMQSTNGVPADLVLRKASLMGGRGEYDSANVLLSKISEAMPDNPMPFIVAGELAMREGKTGVAVQAYNRAVKLQPESPEFTQALADALYSDGREVDAVNAYLRVLQIAPGYIPALQSLGEVALKNGDLGSAQKWYERALSNSSAATLSIRRLSEMAAAAGKHGEALDLLRGGLGKNPQSLELKDMLARVYAVCPDEKYRNPAEALRLAREVQDAGVEGPRSLDTLGLALAANGDFEAAKDAVRQASVLADQARDAKFAAAVKEHVAKIEAGEPYRGLP